MSMPSKEDFAPFVVGARVRLRANGPGSNYCCCDFTFFDVGETGVVVANGHRYLHISVKLDHTTIVGVGDTWGFNPEHLEIISDVELTGFDFEMI